MNVEGQPYQYDKTSTGLFLDPIPSASVSAGLKIYVSREGSYFTASDVSTGTKVPGFAGLYHEYCVIEPSYQYARANRLDIQETLKRDILELEKRITEFYSKRDFHDRHIMTPKKINFI